MKKVLMQESQRKKILFNENVLDDEIKKSAKSWKSYSELIGENPSNFKRKLIQNIEKLNKWLEPLNLQILITPKDETVYVKKKRKEK
jgi:hypothetical protein